MRIEGCEGIELSEEEIEAILLSLKNGEECEVLDHERNRIRIKKGTINPVTVEESRWASVS